MNTQALPRRLRVPAAAVLLLMLLAAACSSDASTVTTEAAEPNAAAPSAAAPTAAEPTTPVASEPETTEPAAAEPETTEPAAAEPESAGPETTEPASAEPAPVATTAPETPAASASTFVADVWADNWFALYIDGVLVGEDSVSIATERSFNKETISFEATYPFTVAIEAKDFKETNSGIEYIGLNNQQMGDGGIIAQITDTTSGSVVAVTGSDWQTFIVHRAPLNTECERDTDPDATCIFEINDFDTNWAASDFDDSGWVAATEWTEAAVSPKDGYNEVNWDASAQLIWGSDLEVDNTILLRTTVG